MKVVALFPWLQPHKETDCGDFSLIPYIRGKAPGGTGTPLQALLDELTLPYMSHSNEPIKAATLMRISGQDIIGELNEDQRDELFLFGELVAFSGLAKREFFAGHINYTNRDNFILAVQSFKQIDPNSGTVIVVRRRDGSCDTTVSRKALRIHCPAHVPRVLSSDILDVTLLKILVTARKKLKPEDWERCYESIWWFNKANTDSAQVTPQEEVVFSVSAFERLLDSRTGVLEDLVPPFLELVNPSESVSIDKCTKSLGRLRGKVKSSSIREAWLRDLVILRHNHAHGMKAPGYHPCWSIEEHLLLASYIFPLMVKRMLHRNLLYRPTSEDEVDINAFESLANADLFSPQTSPDGSERWPWHEIRDTHMWKAKDREARMELSSELCVYRQIF